MSRHACSNAPNAAITRQPARPVPPKNSIALLTGEELGQIAARSLTLYERVDGPRVRIPISEDAFRRKLDIWREIVAEGNDELFCRRMRAEGLNPRDLSAIISDPVFTNSELP